MDHNDKRFNSWKFSSETKLACVFNVAVRQLDKTLRFDLESRRMDLSALMWLHSLSPDVRKQVCDQYLLVKNRHAQRLVKVRYSWGVLLTSVLKWFKTTKPKGRWSMKFRLWAHKVYHSCFGTIFSFVHQLFMYFVKGKCCFLSCSLSTSQSFGSSVRHKILQSFS